jgi:hypothetical protein
MQAILLSSVIPSSCVIPPQTTALRHTSFRGRTKVFTNSSVCIRLILICASEVCLIPLHHLAGPGLLSLEADRPD